MGRAILIIGAGALAVGVIIYSLIECAQTEKYKVRSIPKGAWILLILLLPIIGAVLWLFFGRPKKRTRPLNRSAVAAPTMTRSSCGTWKSGVVNKNTSAGSRNGRTSSNARDVPRERNPSRWTRTIPV